MKTSLLFGTDWYLYFAFFSEEVILNEERTSEEEKMKIIEGESRQTFDCLSKVTKVTVT